MAKFPRPTAFKPLQKDKYICNHTSMEKKKKKKSIYCMTLETKCKAFPERKPAPNLMKLF